ncbi:hypothetical protein NFI96_021463 [Prochilodus magdalenae]|nr:hypothetical protein NFI96_021463 [Prochilodus magdalenae]
MEIRWFKGIDCVCLYKNRQVTEGRGYEGRVNLFAQELQRGNVSLQIRDYRGSDRGDYLCQVTNGDTTEECTHGGGALTDHITYSITSHITSSLCCIQNEGEWTEEERMKMEESALLLELREERFPGPALKNLMSLIEEKKAQEEELREAETELENTAKQTDSNEEELKKEHVERENIREISLEIREIQERTLRERVERRQREEEEIRGRMKAVVDNLGSSQKAVKEIKEKIEQHQKQKHECTRKLSEERNEEKRKELEREVERENKQIKEAEEELRRIQEERRMMVKKLRLEMESREKSAVKADTYFIRNLPELITQTLLTDRQKETDRKMNEKERELETLKLNLSEMKRDKEKILEERNKQLEEVTELEKHRETTEEKNKTIEEKNKTVEEKNELLREKETLLEDTVKEVDSSKEQLDTLRKELQDKSSKLQEMMILLEQQKTELREKDKQLEEKEKLLSEKNTQLMEREKQAEEKDRLLEERNKQLQERTDPDLSVPAKRRNSKEINPPYLSGESCSSASPVSVPVAELRLVLLGRTGCGKSAAGNTILGREERSQAGASTVRQQSESRHGEVAGRQVTVVDTPDWFCPGLSLEELRQDVGLCVRLSAPGPHAFLLVIPVKQSTGEERGMLEKMEEMFGERCWRTTMILFTVTDEVQEKNIEEIIQSGNQEIQRLVEKCGNRFHCLNIKESGDGSQTSELLEKIEKMVEGNREEFYSSEIYLETESQIRAMETKIMKEREEKMVMEEREINFRKT